MGPETSLYQGSWHINHVFTSVLPPFYLYFTLT